VLRLLEAVPASEDLFEANPVLAAMLARSVRPELPAGYGEVADRLRERRTQLLELLGLPPSRWIERMLRRLDLELLEACHLDGLRSLIEAGGRSVRRILQHVHPLSQPVIEVLLDYPAMLAATPALLQEAAPLDADELGELLPRYRDASSPLQAALAAIGFANVESPGMPRPRSLRRLAVVSRAQVPEEDGSWTPASYPRFAESPSGPATLLSWPRVDLRPLADATALWEHGTAQENCIPCDPSYPARARRGDAAFFELGWAVSDGQLPGTIAGQAVPAHQCRFTATLQISAHGGDWAVEDLMLVFNLEAPEWLEEAIAAWVGGLGDAPLPCGDDGVEGLSLTAGPSEPEQLSLPLRLAWSACDTPEALGRASDRPNDPTG
jgi:hypothetical protein